MAICTRCGRKHRRWRDAAHTKPAAYCRKCNAEANKKYRAKIPYRIARKLCPKCSGIILAMFHVKK